MSIITDIKCPICRDRISGKSTDELGETLRMHLSKVHQITRLSEAVPGSMQSGSERDVAGWSGGGPAMLTPQEQSQREEVTRLNQPYGSGSRVEREVETFSSREPYGGSPESSRMIQETDQWKYPRMETREEREVGTWRSEGRYRQSGSSSSIADIPHGGMVHRMFRRSEMTMFMDCPLCGNPVYGSDDDDLSDELRLHFRDYHQIKRG